MKKYYSTLNRFIYMSTNEDIILCCIPLFFSVSDSMFKSLDYNWLCTKLGSVCNNAEHFLLHDVQSSSHKTQKIYFYIFGSFLSNKIEIIKDKNFCKGFHWLKRSLRMEEEESRRVWIIFWGIQNSRQRCSLLFGKLGELYSNLKSFVELLGIFKK